MDVVHFTPFAATLGGLLVGLAAALLFDSTGRMMGASGIAAGALAGTRDPEDRAWRRFFLAGMLAGGAVLLAVRPSVFGPSPGPWWRWIAGGLLVGVGTQLANGCTSGHGVCGIGRLSRRSLAAVPTFMLTAAGTVYLLGGAR